MGLRSPTSNRRRTEIATVSADTYKACRADLYTAGFSVLTPKQGLHGQSLQRQARDAVNGRGPLQSSGRDEQSAAACRTGISGLEILVSGLEILVSGLEILISGLEILVSRLEILVSRLEILVAGLWKIYARPATGVFRAGAGSASDGIS